VDVEEVMRATTDQPASLSLLDGDLLEDLDGIDPTFDAWLTTERERVRDRARTVAEALLACAADEECDLLVMGGYGHSRLYEIITGGTTRRILRTMNVPVLMSH